MKTMLKKGRLPVAVLLVAALAAFTRTAGGEGFEIYLGNKLLVQRFGAAVSSPATLSLHGISAGESLVVKYYHCGQPGKKRVLSIRNQQHQLLQQWSYGDAGSVSAGMACPADDILALRKKHSGTLRLTYSSSDLGTEKTLVVIDLPAAMVKK